jgi:hypothetical protein
VAEEAKRRGESGSKVRVEGGVGRYCEGRGCQALLDSGK